MPWNEPGSLDFVLFEHLQKALSADSSSEETATDVAGTVLSPVRSQPSCGNQLCVLDNNSLRTCYRTRRLRQLRKR